MRHLILSRAVLFLALCAYGDAIACADDSRTFTTWTGTTDTTATGLIRVHNDGEPPAHDLVEELRIGRAFGETADVFGAIAALGVSPAGDLYVIDEHAQEVRVFAPDGTHIRTFGGRGEGPGELAGAYSLEWDRRGRLWIADPGNGRYAVYDSAGSLLFHAPRQLPGVVFPWLGGVGPDGDVYDLTVSTESELINRYTYHRIDSAGNTVAALAPIEYRRRIRQFGSVTLFRLTPRTTFAFDDRGYIWIGDTGEYRLWQRTFDGDTLREITRAHTRVAVTGAQRDSIVAELAEAPPDMRDVEMPRLAPAIDRIIAGDDGFLYVSRFAGDGMPTNFDVFDSEGRLVGTIRSSTGLTTFFVLPQFMNGRVYGVTQDSLGVNHVVRLRIEPPLIGVSL